MSLTRIPILGQAAAGSPVEWIPIQKWRWIRPLKGVQTQEPVYGIEVVGKSLIGKHIVDGDVLIFVYGRRVAPGDLCVVLTPHGLTAKFIQPNDEGEVILKAANGLVPDQIWLCEDVQVLGVVKRVERDL